MEEADRGRFADDIVGKILVNVADKVVLPTETVVNAILVGEVPGSIVGETSGDKVATANGETTANDVETDGSDAGRYTDGIVGKISCDVADEVVLPTEVGKNTGNIVEETGRGSVGKIAYDVGDGTAASNVVSEMSILGGCVVGKVCTTKLFSEATRAE